MFFPGHKKKKKKDRFGFVVVSMLTTILEQVDRFW